MKPITLLLLAGGAGLIWYFTQLGVAGNVVNIVFQGVQIKSLNDFGLQFLVQNVSNAPIIVNSMSANVTLNGNTLGNASYFGSPFSVPANSEQLINIAFKPSLISLPGDISNLLNNGTGGSLEFAATGNMNVNNLVLPINVSTSTTL